MVSDQELREHAATSAEAIAMKALFTSFPAADYAESKHFYEHVLRLPVAREFDGDPHRFTNYDIGAMHLKVYEWLKPYYGSGHSGLFIETVELDDAVARCVAYGAEVTPIEVHDWGGRCSSVTDPCGNIFDLIDANQRGQA